MAAYKSLAAHFYKLLGDDGFDAEWVEESDKSGVKPRSALKNEPVKRGSKNAVPAINSLHLPIQGQHARWSCLVRVYEQSRRILVYSVLPFHVPPESIDRITEMVQRINYGLILGNFELDLNDGEVRYKTYLAAAGTTLNINQVRHLLYANFFTVDRYYHALIACMEGHDDIEQLVIGAENKPDSEQDQVKHDDTDPNFALLGRNIH